MPKLYVVPTPIGHLKDITYRAVETLQEADFILAEDTRTSSKLLHHWGISKPVYAYHAYNEHKILENLTDKIFHATAAVLITDAGTPGISDPGFLLIRQCLAQDIEVECLPGPTAFVPALINSGLPTDRFVFEGFLPVKKGRKTRLNDLAEESRTMIFYESPHRLAKTLKEFKLVFGEERPASISRELTKYHEETRRGTIGELQRHYEEAPPKGEIVIVVSGIKKTTHEEVDDWFATIP